MVPRYLSDEGVGHIVAPLPTRTQALWVGVDGFALSLYPFIPGQIGAKAGLSPQHWQEFGALVKQVHTRQLPPDLLRMLPKETFTPSRRSVIAALEAAVGRQTHANPVEGEFAAFWDSRRDQIHLLVERADALGHHLRQRSLPPVLCHGDMHTWNVLIDTDQRLWLVDWDEAILAPKERDLMFVVGGIGDGVGPDQTACFLQGYGETAIDPVALAYYRYAWAVQDIAAFGEQVLRTDLGEEARRDALRWLKVLFEPGQIVSLASMSDPGGT